MKNTFKLTMILLVTASAMTVFGQTQKTINIDFQEKDGVTMNMSLPISVLESVKPKIEEVLAAVRNHEHEIDFVSIWQAVKDAGPTEYFEMKSHDADLNVSTTETHLMVKIDEKEEGHQIDVILPLALCDALFSNLDHIDYDGIIQALVSLEGQDLVRITSESINGRVWIE